MTQFSSVSLDGVDRSDDVLRADIWRTVNSISNASIIMRNTDGKYNGVFDVQDLVYISVIPDGGIPRPLFWGNIDGPAVTLRGVDAESIWDEYIQIRAYGAGQDLLFHNDFDYSYPDLGAATQTLNDVLNDVFNVQLPATNPTNVVYSNRIPDNTPVVGSVEFREGSNFLATLQSVFQQGFNTGTGARTPWIFYVEDITRELQTGAPGFSANGVTLNSVSGDYANNNIIGEVEYQTHDGDKFYNYVKIYGKNPMFDGYTEGNSASWSFTPAGQGQDDTGNVKVGSYSQVAYNNNPPNVDTYHRYELPVNNYTAFDFSKGEVGVWCYYDNVAGAPGTPGVGNRVNGTPGFPTECWLWLRLTDGAARAADYYGDSTRVYLNNWCWCSFPLGQHGGNVGLLANEWFLTNPNFDWSDIRKLWFHLYEGGASVTFESHLYLDGLTIPEPCIAVAENVVAPQRRRPLVDYYSHINTQNSLDQNANALLHQVGSTSINKLNLRTPGDYRLRYAAESLDVNIPSLGLNTAVFYITELHHTIQPYTDVSGGYGHDWMTDLQLAPISGVAYDMGRLRDGSFHSSSQGVMRTGTGLRIK